jgi:hypothetical protein
MAVSQRKHQASGRGDLFQKGRKKRPHFIERQISRKIQPWTAPKDRRIYKVVLPACSLRLAKVWGRWASCGITCDAALLKEIPMGRLSNNSYVNSLKCYDSAMRKLAAPE